MILARCKLGRYKVTSIEGRKKLKTYLAKLGIEQGTILTKRGTCPLHDPIKVFVEGKNHITILNKSIARKINVDYY